MITRNSTEALPMRQHLPVSKDVQEKQAKAIVDKRPAFVHGNTACSMIIHYNVKLPHFESCTKQKLKCKMKSSIT